MHMTYQDCPECGARKIHESVSLCEVCEVSQRYEKRIGELQALLDLAIDAVLTALEKECGL
jgi:predicted nucleic-acid-binding Zn-ribbon protein